MKLFFIVGTGRCGTQMLRNILNTWNSVTILPETHFLIALYDKYKLNKICLSDYISVIDEVYGASGNKWVEVIFNSSDRYLNTYKEDFQSYCSKYNIEGNIRDYTEAFYEFLYGKGFIFGDKTPHYGTNLDIIQMIWPEAKIIHLIRDGIDCAHSMLGHKSFVKYINATIDPKDLDRLMYQGKQLSFSEEIPTIDEALYFWEKTILAIEQSYSNIDAKKTVIKYEDIVFYPEQTINQIATFLEINQDDKALKKAISIPRPFPEKHQVKKLSDSEYERCCNLVKETMNTFGYPYSVSINRSILEFFNEFYRGRYNYLQIFWKSLKKTIKQLIERS